MWERGFLLSEIEESVVHICLGRCLYGVISWFGGVHLLAFAIDRWYIFAAAL